MEAEGGSEGCEEAFYTESACQEIWCISHDLALYMVKETKHRTQIEVFTFLLYILNSLLSGLEIWIPWIHLKINSNFQSNLTFFFFFFFLCWELINAQKRKDVLVLQWLQSKVFKHIWPVSVFQSSRNYEAGENRSGYCCFSTSLFCRTFIGN